jgi:hypothetical protein
VSVHSPYQIAVGADAEFLLASAFVVLVVNPLVFIYPYVV